MNNNILLAVSQKLKYSRPPYTVKLMHDASCIDWNSVIDDQIDICLDIIDRIMVAIIVCSFDVHGPEREDYKKLFVKIADNIKSSSLTNRSPKILEFFSQYEKYLKNM